MYQKQGAKALNFKLDNIQRFCDYLNNPHQQFKSIHVAGTNGKGSSSHMLASILQEAGYKIGLYTSPHLKDFRERVKVNGQVVSKQFVMGFIKKNKSYIEANNLSFFELTVAMAFYCFAKQKVDVAVIEVGLGGRFDSTNIITPEACLITNIGLDHTQMLGDTLEKIAFEKAGIIKSNIPVVVSEVLPETKKVFKDVAVKNNAPLTFAKTKKYYKTDLLGSYQQKNIQGVIEVVSQLKNFSITEENIENGLQNVVKNTGLMGRWQILQNNPKVIADTAHNKEGLLLVIQQLKKEVYNNLHIVFGVVNDKDLEEILGLLPKYATYYFCKPAIERGLNEVVLQKESKKHELQGEVFASVTEAYNAALQQASKTDVVYVGGSTFVVAEIL
jgi:dihydrofolate synthase/folylpolyglutamate synthase